MSRRCPPCPPRAYLAGLGDAPDTDAFRHWFAGSRVVDPQGRPLVVYHGSKFTGFTTFRFKGEAEIGPHFGTYEAALEAAGERFLRKEQLPEHIRAFYLSIQNPIKLEDCKWTDGIGLVNDEPITVEGVLSGDPYYLGRGVLLQLVQTRRLSARKARDLSVEFLKSKSAADGRGAYLAKILLSLGFDGVVYKNNHEDIGSLSWIVLDPRQIKSATDNVGTFDPHNPSVLAGTRRWR